MRTIFTKIPPKSLLKRIISQTHLYSTQAQAQAQTQAQKLDRIANELLSLNAVELHDYSALFRLKMGLKNSGPSSLGPGSRPLGSGQPGAEAEAVVEKTAFDVKLEKFDAAAKIKIIKEVRSFTDLGLKEAKALVESVPAVLKKGVTKEEGDSILGKLKELGATVVLE